MTTPSRISYEWSWKCLSLFRNFNDGNGGGGSARIFTLKPQWAFRFWQEWFLYWIGVWPHPNPYIYYSRWESYYLREHPDCEDAFKAFCNHSEPGTLLKLQPRFFK